MSNRLSISRQCRSAFTLIELLVVVAIIALLVSILLPSLGRARELTRRTICTSNTRGIAQAFNTYATENRDWFPVAGWSTDRNRRALNSFENVWLEWLMSPYLAPAYAERGASEGPVGNWFVGGGQWLCPSSGAEVREDGNGLARYDWSNVGLGLSGVNAYSGPMYNWDMAVGWNRGNSDRPADADRAWTLTFFTKPSGMPIQWCSTRLVDTNVDDPHWHSRTAARRASLTGTRRC